MGLVIWDGERWRGVTLGPCGAAVEGWRRRARLAVPRRGALVEIGAPALRRRLRRGRKVPRCAREHVKKDKNHNSVEQQQNTIHKDVSVQTDKQPVHISTQTSPGKPTPREVLTQTQNKLETQPIDANTNTDDKENITKRKKLNEKRISQVQNEKRPKQSSQSSTSDSEDTVVIPAKRVVPVKARLKSTETETQSDSSSGSPQYKELEVTEEDLLYIRNFLEKDDRLGVDLYKFDAFEEYRQRVLYDLNPLVRVERCNTIAELAFARALGLRAVRDAPEPHKAHRHSPASTSRRARSPESASSNQALSALAKPTHTKHTAPRAVPAAAPRAPDVAAKAERRKKAVLRPLVYKRSSVANGREYSSKEDHVIVAWVSAGREHCVNGNRVWKQLEEQYEGIAGVARSWHSLRNRYLRYLLPTLYAMALPAEQVQRLRAAAATGELKAKKQRLQESALPAPAAVNSASARLRPPRVLQRGTDSPPRLRHRADPTPPLSPNKRTKHSTRKSDDEANNNKPTDNNQRNIKDRTDQSEESNRKRNNVNASSPSRKFGGNSSPSRKFGGNSSPNRKFGGNSSPNRKFGGNSSPSRKIGGDKSDSSPSRKFRANNDSSPSRKYGGNSSPSRIIGGNKSDSSPIRKFRANNDSSPSRKYGNSPSRKIRSNNDSSPTRKSQRTLKERNDKRETRKRVREDSPAPTYKELTRRFALRNKSTPITSDSTDLAEQPSSNKQKKQTGKRRLYNPARL